MVEFALVLPLLLLLLLAMIDFGRAFNDWLSANHLANEAARWAIVNKSPEPGVALDTAIEQQADTGDVQSGPSVTFCYTGSGSAGDSVEATVSRQYQWLSVLGNGSLFGLELRPSTLASTATMRIEVPYDNTAYSAVQCP